MAVFQRVLKTTISDFLREEEMNIMKNQVITAMLMDKKRIKYNCSGTDLNWPIRSARGTMLPYSDGEANQFNRVNRHQRASLPWRGYVITEAITEMEKLMNRGEEALVKYSTELAEWMKEDLEYNFNAKFYLDQTVAANAEDITGLQSVTGNGGGSGGTNGNFPQPTATYAGVNCTLGAYGGSALNGSTWPTGQFTNLYYFWAPLILSSNNSLWGASTNNWANLCTTLLRYGRVYNKNLKGQQGKLDCWIVDGTMFVQLQEATAAKERIQVERNASSSNLVKLGFQDVMNYDGVDIVYDNDCPANNAFGIHFDSLRLNCMYDQMFRSHDMDDINTLSNKLLVGFFGNLQINPRALVNIQPAG